MKVTKSELLEMIREELNLGRYFKDREFMSGNVRPSQSGGFKDLNWFKRMLGFKSPLADEFMNELERHMGKVDRYLTRSIEQQDYDELSALIDLNIKFLPVILKRLPDKEQQSRGARLVRRHKPLFDELLAARSEVAARDFELQAQVRADEEKERERLRRKKEHDEWKTEKAEEERRRRSSGSGESEEYSTWEGGDLRFRKKGDYRDYRSRGYGAVGVTPKGDPYGGSLSMDDLGESKKSKLKRIIREELAKKISKLNKEN
tara:strand:+ start:1907 stop:2689 length:783 start_codon:yes stop_codon:yes gene_type:complete